MLEQCKSSLLKGTTLTHQPEIAPSGNVIWYDMEWLNTEALEAAIVSIGRRGRASWVAFELQHV